MIKNILSPFGWLYAALTRARETLYRKGVFKSHDLLGLTISVGNFTVGGTGKTPLAAHIAQLLAARGGRVCVLTRGYGRRNPQARVVVSDGERVFAGAREAGDEPFELALKLKGISAVVADADRVSAALWARENLKTTAFVLDDGFQHLKVKRDLDVVCVDATNPFGNGKVLPRGILREPLENLRRAHAVVVTRANLVGEEKIAEIKSEIRKYNKTAEIFVCKNTITDLTALEEFYAKTQRAQRKAEDGRKIETENQPAKDKGQKTNDRFLAFCALGNPENFFAQLRMENFDLAATRAFRDHHFYAQDDVDRLEKQAREKGAAGFLTTAKDAVKLLDLNFNMPCFVVENELVFNEEKEFERLIESRARTAFND